MQLYDPAAHEPLVEVEWDEEQARAAGDRIAARAVERFAPGDDHSLWSGAAGTLWALDRLGHGRGAEGLDPAKGAGRGLMAGEVGIRLVSWRLEPAPAKADRLYDLVRGNVRSPAHELFEGAPGTMLAALHLYEATGEERWRALWLECAAYVLGEWRPDPERGCRLWIQYRKGRLVRSIGAGHGFASNVRSLLRGAALLDDERRVEIERDAAETAGALALREDGLANWETSADPFWAAEQPIRVQWCHGAPGLVTSLWTLPRDERTDALLEAAGELVWRAGPLRKGPGLCHGTAGNACSFLALHRRTGDPLWLERARAFALHAAAQVERGDPGDALWTGALGTALVLRACSDGWDGMPVLDVL